jgi:hypothetical protein
MKKIILLMLITGNLLFAIRVTDYDIAYFKQISELPNIQKAVAKAKIEGYQNQFKKQRELETKALEEQLDKKD